MRLIIYIFLVLCFNKTYSQKSTIENINETTRNILDIFGKKKENKEENSQTLIEKKTLKAASDNTTSLNAICKELCINNYNKNNAKVELKDKSSLKTTTVAVMAKDKSCQFDFPQGIYILYIFLNDKLVKTTDVKIEEDFKTIEIPE